MLQLSGLNIENIANSGQCFRWKRIAIEHYITTFEKHIFEIKDNKLLTPNIDKDIVERYFELDKNYQEILSTLSNDTFVQIAIYHLPGLRLLRQDPLEMIISFLLSQNNTVKNVSTCLERIQAKCNTYYFPTIDDLRKLTEKDFVDMRCGYRSKYLYENIKFFNDELEKDRQLFISLGELDSHDLRKYLVERVGIGEKVADCILLYGFNRTDIVPMDTWVLQASVNLYNLKSNAKNSYVRDFWKDKFGEYAGYAQLFLFDYLRQNSKKGQNILELFDKNIYKNAQNTTTSKQ